MLELKILNPTEDGFVQVIEWNHEELKALICAKMQEYNGLVLTDSQIGEGKKELANLRKLKEAIEGERKRIKKMCLAPYEAFEAQVKEITALIDGPISLIDGQVKEYDREKRNQKRNQIMDFYEAHIGQLRGILPFDRVLNEKMLNATVSMKSIETDIQALIDRVNKDLDTIEGLGTKYDAQIRDMYIRTLDLSAAMSEKARLEEQERQLEARRVAHEAERARREEETRKAVEEAEKKRLEVQRELEAAARRQAEEAAVQRVMEPAAEEVPQYTVSVEIIGRRDQLVSFERFLKENGITYNTLRKAKRIN